MQADPPNQAARPPADWEDLELPDMRLRSLLWNFGPGVILMMTGIGTSHLVTAPAAGGRFEFALLWAIPIAYIFKYYGFEMAFRFTNATGKSIIEAYGTAWGKWPLWYVLITTIIQAALGQAGRLIAASAVLFYIFTASLGLPVSMAGYGAILGIVSVAILLRGRYKTVEWAAKILAAILLVSTLAVYFVEPAPISALGHFFQVETPVGSWLIIAAFLGLLPTGMDVSLQASEWGKAKRVGMAKIRKRLEATGLAGRFDSSDPHKEDLTVQTAIMPPKAREYARRWFVIGLWDFRLGHLVSFVIASVFLLLSAVWLYPSPVEGRAVMGEIAGIFTLSVGPWMMIVFMLGAFAATFSTAFNYFDGWPRIVGACSRNLFPGTAKLPGIDRAELTEEHRKTWYSEYNIYRTTMIYSLVASVVIIAGFERPVLLVLLASALAFFIAPVVFYLNLYYCLTVIPKEDKAFYPSLPQRWLAWGSLVVFIGLTVAGAIPLAGRIREALFGG
ncbi:MAG: divalent metal cation transporter [Gemmatimonadota bacterium]|nr:MAG: divalent metal cation transporter [Gemmatimonadota bacterium]